LAATLLALTAQAVQAQNAADYQRAVNAAYEKYKSLKEGKNADYIPALARVNPDLFGIALVTPDGRVYTAGDVSSEVSIQSVSKVFTMAHVFQQSGEKAVEENIGVDATGQPFNSIVAIEQYKGKEMNPLVNAGAITTTSMIEGGSADAIWSTIIATLDDFAGRQLSVNQEVYKSEAETNQRNQAIAMLMYAYGHIKANPLQATDLYTRQCSVNVNARDLATMAATLASGGRNPITSKQVIENRHVAPTLAVMATAGLYDDSGKWLFATGLPAKSGVGGGLIAVSPGRFGIAVVSPPLDEAGNSVRGQRAITDISAALGGNPYVVPVSAVAKR
ncbi:MAG TPA: glutaminase A, partial [Gemmatimonadaceae bacterium]|nr:glutaminase A [Gemmatimonadaceae bacterium]